MNLEPQTKLALFYFSLARNWIKVKKENPEGSAKIFTKLVNDMDQFRKINTPSIQFDEMFKIMLAVGKIGGEYRKIFVTMRSNFDPDTIPILDLQNHMENIGDVEGVKSYCKKWKIFFDHMDNFMKFLDESKRKQA